MKGLIYKDCIVFLKSIEKKTAVLAACACILLIYKGRMHGGTLASVMFAMVIGIQNLYVFTADEKTDWKKYQLALPVSSFYAVLCKYISVLYTIGISLSASIVFSFITGAVYRHFDVRLLCISMSAAVIVPLLWTGIGMPLTYWFGTRSAQAMGVLMVFPVFYLVKYFEDSLGFDAASDFITPYLSAAGTAAVILFLLSFFISTAGYARKS